jgi:Cytochrome bd terminal oxidase subunit I
VTNVAVIAGLLALRPGWLRMVCWPSVGGRTGSLGDAARGTPVNALDVSRWQFGITTVYHFIFVPLTIGLSVLVAVMQTVWLARKDPAWLRVTKFFGALFLINFAVGVVTGIVQEFQFGMNWPAYSRFAGDVFGAPLAMEALLAAPAPAGPA